MSIGTDLRQIRESRNISLETVSVKTKIPVKYLEAIEEENFQVFPSQTYARGFIRAYAKVIGADIHVMTRQFNSETQPEAVKIEPLQVHEEARKGWEWRPAWSKGAGARPERQFEGDLNLELVDDSSGRSASVEPPTRWSKSPALRRSRSFKLDNRALAVVAGLIVAVLAVGYGRKLFSKIKWGGTASQTETAASQGTGTPPVADKYQHLVLKCLDASWVRVVGDDGKAVEADLAEGDVRTYQAVNGFKVRIGNAGGVDVQYNGKPLGVLGVRGQVKDMQLPPATDGTKK